MNPVHKTVSSRGKGPPQIRYRPLVAPPGRCRQGADHRLFPQKDGAGCHE
jgi:hypothetical protein